VDARIVVWYLVEMKIEKIYNWTPLKVRLGKEEPKEAPILRHNSALRPKGGKQLLSHDTYNGIFSRQNAHYYKYSVANYMQKTKSRSGCVGNKSGSKTILRKARGSEKA
jgi:hypothetical protein